MSAIRISIIIPFYNVEKYIVQCLDSVYAQDIPESEYEVICVNDVSTDNSRNLVIEYQRNHSSLNLIDHEESKLAGSARNTGLRAAQGKYVWFVDSDDCIKENVLRELLEIADKNDLEILQFNASRFTGQGKERKIHDWEFYSSLDTGVITGIDFLNMEIPYTQKPITTWSKIYQRFFLLQNNLFFPERVYYEDVIHALSAWLCAERLMHKSQIVYYYRTNPDGYTNTSFNGIKALDYMCSYIQCLEKIKAYEAFPFFNEIKNHYLKKQATLLIFCNLPLKEKWIFYKRLRTVDRSILAKYSKGCKSFFLTHSWAMLILFLFPAPLLRTLWRFFRRKDT